MNWENFQTAYQNASEDKRAIVSGSAVPQCVAKAVNEGKVDQAQAKVVTQLFSIQYLDSNQKDAALTELRQAGVPDGEELFKSLGFCVASMPADTNTDLTDEIKEAEAALSETAAIGQDTPSIPTEEPAYSSTQESILNESVNNKA
tara:strand:+ start:361 stop:798 length:438 start_codon:yes stop_codon:yes gene_type:complete